MAQTYRTWDQPVPDEHKTTAEDAAVILSLATILVLSAVLIAVLLLEFLDVLPARIGAVLVATIFIFCGVVGRAVLVRALSLPSFHKGGTPVMRSFNRRPPRRRPIGAARA